MIDISRSNHDAYYRYKMPRLVVKHEGKVGGIKTVIVNLPDIASSLKRPPLYILKYISYELATQSKVDNSKYTINGKHEVSRVQELVYDFIDTYVMCSFCDNPETFYVDEGGLSMECLACGRRTSVRSSKLSSVILRDVEKSGSTRSDSYFCTETGVESRSDDEVRRILEQPGDRSREVCDLLRSSNVSDEGIVERLLWTGEGVFGKCNRICEYIPTKTVLGTFERFIESNRKEGEVQKYLKALEESGVFRRSELFKYFTKPQGNKRSPELKKEVSEYFSN